MKNGLFLKSKKRKEKEKEYRKDIYLNKEYIWLRKKEFFKYFAKQTDTLILITVLNFTT